MAELACCLYLYFHCFRQSDCLASWVCGLLSTRSTRDTQQSLLASAWTPVPKQQLCRLYQPCCQALVTSVSVMWPPRGRHLLSSVPRRPRPVLRTTARRGSACLGRNTAVIRRNTRLGPGNSASARPFLLSILCPTATDFYKFEWFFLWRNRVPVACVHLGTTLHRQVIIDHQIPNCLHQKVR